MHKNTSPLQYTARQTYAILPAPSTTESQWSSLQSSPGLQAIAGVAVEIMHTKQNTSCFMCLDVVSKVSDTLQLSATQRLISQLALNGHISSWPSQASERKPNQHVGVMPQFHQTWTPMMQWQVWQRWFDDVQSKIYSTDRLSSANGCDSNWYDRMNLLKFWKILIQKKKSLSPHNEQSVANTVDNDCFRSSRWT